MQSEDPINKSKAISIISLETGYGRRVIENKMNELAQGGKITMFPDPGDRRIVLISRADVQVIIQSLKKGSA